jgi:hypothetical protein
MPAELTDQKQLSTVIDYLRNTNATEELMLDEVLSHKDVLASSDAKKYIQDVPILLEFIGEVMSDILMLTKDAVENSLKLIHNQREDAEDERLSEKNNKKKDTKKDKGSSGVTFSDAKKEVGNNPLLMLLGAGSFLIGSIVGAVEQLTVFVKSAFKEPKFGKAISGLVKTIGGKISSLIDFGKDTVGKIVGGVKGAFVKLFSKVISIFSFIGEITNFIKGIFGPAINEISDFIGKGVKFFSSGGSGFMDDFGKVFTKIKFFFDLGKSFGKAIVRLLGKLALPFTIIKGIWDTVIGAIDGYKEGGITGAFKGGISGLLNSLVGSLLDLVKDGVSWLLGALGFDKAEKFLDSFSFSDLISKLVGSIVDGVVYYFNYLKEKFSIDKFAKAFDEFNIFGIFAVLAGGIADTFKNSISWIFEKFGMGEISEMLDGFSFQDIYTKILQSIKDTISAVGDWFAAMPDKISNLSVNVSELADQFIKTILQNVLPRMDANSAWYSPMNLAAAAIPSSVYEYAGMNPETGEIIKKSEPKISAVPNDTVTGVSTNPNTSMSPTIINNVSRGGDVHNVSNSNVNQNVNGAVGPIITGSAMGLYAF